MARNDDTTGRDALVQAFDRLFDRAARKLNVECDEEEKAEAKKQFLERFATLLDALEKVPVGELPDDVISSMERTIDEIRPTEVVGLMASLPLAQQGHEMLRSVAYRAAEQRLLEHLIRQADDRYGGN